MRRTAPLVTAAVILGAIFLAQGGSAAVENLVKAVRTMTDMHSIATAWEARATDTNKYNAAGACSIPSTTATPATMGTMLSPTYIKVLPPKDGWNTGWEYRIGAQSYGIISYGKDSVANGGGAYTCGPTTNFDCDIVYSEGSFLAYPDGVQTQ